MNAHKRFSFLVALSLFATVPAIAQSPVNFGDTFLLRGSSGKYLSAWPNEELRMSPNTAQWEQWEYIDEGGGRRRIQSFHGTTLEMHFKNSRTPRPIHGPWFNEDGHPSVMRLHPWHMRSSRPRPNRTRSSSG